MCWVLGIWAVLGNFGKEIWISKSKDCKRSWKWSPFVHMYIHKWLKQLPFDNLHFLQFICYLLVIYLYIFVACYWHLCWFRRFEGVYYLICVDVTYFYFLLSNMYYVVLIAGDWDIQLQPGWFNDRRSEDIFILDCHRSIFVWIVQRVDQKQKAQALAIGKVYGFTFYIYYFVFQLEVVGTHTWF